MAVVRRESGVKTESTGSGRPRCEVYTSVADRRPHAHRGAGRVELDGAFTETARPSWLSGFMYRLAIWLLLSASVSIAAPSDLTVERLWSFARLGPFDISPDGRTAAVTASTFSVEADEGGSKIWLFDIDGRRGVRQLTAAPGSDTRPRWHPDGRHLFFLGTRDDKPAQLYRIAVDGGEAQALTDLPVPVREYRIVENGRTVIFEASTWPDLDADFVRVNARLEANEADKTQAKISETRILRYWNRYLTDGRVPHLFKLNIATGAIVDLLPGFDRVTGFEDFEWDASADGAQLVYAANATATPYRELNFDLFLKSPGGQERNLTADNPADDVRPVFSPDGRRIAYGRYRRAGIASDFRQLALIDLGDDEDIGRIIVDDMKSHVADWRFDRSGERVFFHSADGGRTHLYQWRNGHMGQLAKGGTTSDVQPAGRGVVYAYQDFTSPADLWYLAPGESPRRFTALNESRVKATRFGRYDSVELHGYGGDTIQMFVAYPPGYRRRDSHPAVLLSHGGPFSAWNDAFSYRWHPGLLAARGYVVAMPNFHGSSGFGQDFADSILGNHGEKPVADSLAAADWLVASAGVDDDRIAIAGGSYGGYLTALLTGKSDRFKAAIVHAGVYDISQQFASDSHWARPSAYGDAPWTDPVRLDAWSPSRFAPAMNTPTLILHGEKDYRVPVTQGINLHGALTGKGVPSRIVVFPEEHHWIVRPQAARLWWNEVFAWLDRWNPVETSARAAPSADPAPASP